MRQSREIDGDMEGTLIIHSKSTVFNIVNPLTINNIYLKNHYM